MRPLLVATLCLSVFGLSACGNRAEQVHLPFPDPPPEARAMILVTPDGDGMTVQAIDLGESRAALKILVEDYDPASTVPIHILYYVASLDTLGLMPGIIAPATAGAPFAELPTPERIYIAALPPNKTDVHWQTAPAVDAEVASFRRGISESDCRRFAQDGVFGPFEGQPRYAVALDSGRALVGTDEDVAYIVSETAATPFDLGITAEVTTAARVGPRSVWFGDRSGRLWRSVLTADGLTPASQIASTAFIGRPILSLDGGPVAGGEEVFALIWDGTVGRYADDRWVDLGRSGEDIEGDNRLRWVEPGRAYEFKRGRDRIHRYGTEPGMPSAESVDSGSGVMSIQVVPDFGLVIGTVDGDFMRREDNGFWSFIGGDYGWWGLDETPYAGGFAFLLASGSIGQVLPDGFFCETEQVTSYIGDGYLVSVGRDLIVALEPSDFRQTEIRYLKAL